MKTMQGYTCNMTLINFEWQTALDMMAGKAIQVSRYDYIIAAATRCITEQPPPLAHDYRAKAYADKADSKAAQADFEQAIAMAKKDGSPIVPLHKIYEDRADLFLQLGDRTKAEADLREAIRLNSTSYSAKDKLENLDAKLAEARKKAAISNPKTADDYVIVGEACDGQGKYNEALAAYSKSISMKPSAAAHIGKAKTYRMMERPEAALTELDRAIALAPKDIAPLSLSGYINRDLSRRDAAAADFEQALGIADAKTKPDMLIGRGIAYAGQDRYDATLKNLDAALAYSSLDVYSKINALTSKGAALGEQAKSATALASYNAAIAAAGNDYIAKLQAIDAYLRRGKLYASQGKTDMAKADFNALCPGSAAYFYRMASLIGSSPKGALLRWSLYGLAAGLLAAGMVWIKYRLLVLDHAVELYGLIVAGVFIALGIWLGLRLSKPKTIVREVPIIRQEIVVKEIRVLQDAETAPEVRAANLEETGISARELDVLHLLCKGHSNAEIAGQLFVSPNTVKTHVSNLLFKLDVKRRTQVAEKARTLGLV